MYIYKNIPYFLIPVLLMSGCGDNKSDKKSNSTSYKPYNPPTYPPYKPPTSIPPTSPSEHARYTGPFDYTASLFHQQWYLKNNGQILYDFTQGTKGVDLNLTIPNEFKGKSVKVLIADSGIDKTHPNLKDKILPKSSIDFTKGNIIKNGDPDLDADESDHGTKVAGIIAAKPLSNGFTGIAPEAKIASANVISRFINKSTLSILDQTLQTYDYAQQYKFDIINESYGDRSNFHLNKSVNNRTTYTKIKENSKNSFIIVKAAGNGTCDNTKNLELDYLKNFDEKDIYKYYGNIPPKNSEAELYFRALRPIMSHFDSTINNPYMITVANATSKGIIDFSSSIGANLWITAFGSGYRSAIKNDKLLTQVPETGDYSEKYLSKIFTTRIHTAPLKNKSSTLDEAYFPNEYKNLYVTNFSGTSAATPMVSGIIALMLEANPNLSLRDVKYILAKTANTELINKFQPKPYCIKVLENMKEFEDNFKDFWDINIWEPNKAGFYFNNYYGFGLIDADKAIEQAKKFGDTHKYKNETEEFELMSKAINEQIKPNNINEFNLDIKDEDDLQIEAIQVIPAIKTNKADGLGIKIKSPSGTESILLYPGNSFIYLDKTNKKVLNEKYPLDSFVNLKNEFCCSYLSNAFYEESSKGKWTISILNSNKSGNLLNDYATMIGWKIKIIGHKIN